MENLELKSYRPDVEGQCSLETMVFPNIVMLACRQNSTYQLISCIIFEIIFMELCSTLIECRYRFVGLDRDIGLP